MSFDGIAPYYCLMEAVLAGTKLQRCRLMWLDQVDDVKEILLVGEGHGRFIEVCAKRFPKAQLTCVDASAQMLRIAEAHWLRAGGLSGRARFQREELPEWTPPAGRYDLIATHFFLDCFPPETLADVVAKLASAMAPGGKWLISDFALPARGWRRWRAKWILATAYAFFRRVTGLAAAHLTSPDELLVRAGLELKCRRTIEWGLLHTDLWMRSQNKV